MDSDSLEKRGLLYLIFIVFYIFFVVGFVCCLLILFTLPETKNKSLKEIQMNFVKKKDGVVV